MLINILVSVSLSPEAEASLNRGFHSTGLKRMGEAHGHGHGHDEPYYIHAKHMYDLDRMKHQKVKVPATFCLRCRRHRCWTAYFAVVYQQRKTASALANHVAAIRAATCEHLK
ncbi:hypothetical protein AAG906_012217 [Vitis piasezkii]